MKKVQILLIDGGGSEFIKQIFPDSRFEYSIQDQVISQKTIIKNLFNVRLILKSLYYFLFGLYPSNFGIKKRLYGSIILSGVSKAESNLVIGYKGSFSVWFGLVAMNNPKIEFIGIAWAQIHERILRRTTLAHNIKYFVFGEYDVSAYVSLGHDPKNLYPVGGLLGGYYKSIISERQKNVKYDICIVSQVVDMWFEEGEGQNQPRKQGKRIFEKLMEHVVRYLSENKDKQYKVAVALRPQDKSLTKGEYEQDYFIKYLEGFDYHLIQNYPLEFSTYRAMDESDIIINHYSTSCFEALSWDKKILFCQFYDYPKFPLPDDLPWRVVDPNYEVFKNELDSLIAIEQKDYLASVVTIKNKYNKFDINNPPQEIIMKHIDEIIQD